jgi:hypothetical protein
MAIKLAITKENDNRNCKKYTRNDLRVKNDLRDRNMKEGGYRRMDKYR